VYSNDLNSHIQQLELALKTLHENRISCRPTKTEIGFAEVEYLSHRLSAQSVCISEKRIKAIGKIQAPKNLKALQRVLGMFNYWKKYLKDILRILTTCANSSRKTLTLNGLQSAKRS